MRKILLLLVILGTNAFAVSYKKCDCINNCYTNKMLPYCSTVSKCYKTTEADYYDAIASDRAKVALDSHRYCINHMAGVMRDNQ